MRTVCAGVDHITQEARTAAAGGRIARQLGQELLLIRNTALLAAQAGRTDRSNGPREETESASRTIQEVRSIAMPLRASGVGSAWIDPGPNFFARRY